MAEVLVAISAIASITQLVVYIVKTTKAVTKFHSTIQNAPAQIRRIEEKLGTLKNVVEETQTYQQLFDDDLVLPLDLRQALFETVKRTNETVTRIQSRLELDEKSSRESLRGKMKWAAKAKHKTEQELHQLEHCEEQLGNIIQLITL
jgi:chromosome segregation ATPase